jgi:hypothetical protein
VGNAHPDYCALRASQFVGILGRADRLVETAVGNVLSDDCVRVFDRETDETKEARVFVRAKDAYFTLVEEETVLFEVFVVQDFDRTDRAGGLLDACVHNAEIAFAEFLAEFEVVLADKKFGEERGKLADVAALIHLTELFLRLERGNCISYDDLSRDYMSKHKGL